MRTLTCGRGRPWAAHMRRKRNSSTERTSAGSTAPTSTCRSFALPRRRGRAITSAASGAGGMWRWTWACSKALNSALRGATAAWSRSVRIGVVTGIPRCDRDVCGGEPLAVDEDAVAPRWPGRRRDRHLGERRSPHHPPQRGGRRVAQDRAAPPSASTPACHADSRARGHVADGVDAGVARDQPAGLATPLDLRPREPRIEQLSVRDVAVLPRREPREATNVVSTAIAPRGDIRRGFAP